MQIVNFLDLQFGRGQGHVISNIDQVSLPVLEFAKHHLQIRQSNVN